MLTLLEIFGVQPSAPILPLALGGMPATDPIQVKGIDGLGPVKSDITTSPYGTGRGEALNAISTGKRNIVVKLGLNPDWQDQTVEGLRQLLYRYFMTGSYVRLRFTSTHLPTCETQEAYVESMEPNMFSRDPEIVISIICLKPDFVAVEETTIEDVIVSTASPTVFEYEGTAETGVAVEVRSSVARPSFTGTITVLFQSIENHSFVVGPVTVDTTKLFRLNTTPGDKYVRNVTVPGGVPTNLLRHVVSPIVWPKLEPGENGFDVLSTNGPSGSEWELSYFAKFGGL